MRNILVFHLWQEGECINFSQWLKPECLIELKFSNLSFSHGEARRFCRRLLCRLFQYMQCLFSSFQRVVKTYKGKLQITVRVLLINLEGSIRLRGKSCAKQKKDNGMGFRDLISFNQALLRSLGWWIMQYPDTSLGEILNARYFQRVDFLNCNLASNSFYAWKSILWGREIIKAYSRWKIDKVSVNT